jgi:hypothetical protein
MPPAPQGIMAADTSPAPTGKETMSYLGSSVKPAMITVCMGLAACGSSGSPPGDGPVEFLQRDCSGCHSAQATAAAPAHPSVNGFVGAFHTTGAKATCLQCHTETEKLTQLHADPKGTPPTSGLRETKVTEANCFACHGSYAALTTLTAGSTVLTDNGQGVNEAGHPKTVNPHAAPALTPAHVTAGMSCQSCHSSHKALVAQAYCATCHHMGVYECRTCHQ